MANSMPYTSAVIRRLIRNLRLVVAHWFLARAERIVPADLDLVRLSILRAELRTLDAMNFDPMKYEDYAAVDRH